MSGGLVTATESLRGHQPWWLALNIIRPSSVAECTWLLLLSQVFPLDYILITVITVYFVITSMAGIRNMGIWFFWIRVRKGSTWGEKIKCMVLITFFFFFVTPAVQNKTKENSPTGSSVPLHDSSFDYTSHQLHDLQLGSTVCHVRKPEVSCTGEEQCSYR